LAVLQELNLKTGKLLDDGCEKAGVVDDGSIFLKL